MEKLSIEMALNIYNSLHNNEIINKYEEARSIILEFASVKAERELYKEVNGVDYFIELPYKTISFTKDGAVWEENSFSCCKSKSGGVTTMACLSLCGYSRKHIIEILERWIKEDQEEMKEEGK